METRSDQHKIPSGLTLEVIARRRDGCPIHLDEDDWEILWEFVNADDFVKILAIWGFPIEDFEFEIANYRSSAGCTDDISVVKAGFNIPIDLSLSSLLKNVKMWDDLSDPANAAFHAEYKGGEETLLIDNVGLEQDRKEVCIDFYIRFAKDT